MHSIVKERGRPTHPPQVFFTRAKRQREALLRKRLCHIAAFSDSKMNPWHAANLLGVPADASLEEVKKSFREKAKALHPDTATAVATRTLDDDGGDITFAELREAYEILVKRAGKAKSGYGVASRVYGPGMLARFEAAKNWRERQGATSGPVKAARENTTPRDTGLAACQGGDLNRSADGFGFRYTGGGAQNTRMTVDDVEVLETVLRQHKAFRSQPSDATLSRRTIASEVPLNARKIAHAFSSPKIAVVGVAGVALLCTTTCLIYLLSK